MKHPAMQAIVDSFQRETFGTGMSEAMRLNICVICKEKITGFTSDITAREHAISGTCEECQRVIFKPVEVE